MEYTTSRANLQPFPPIFFPPRRRIAPPALPHCAAGVAALRRQRACLTFVCVKVSLARNPLNLMSFTLRIPPLNHPFRGDFPELEALSKIRSPAPERGGGQGEGFVSADACQETVCAYLRFDRDCQGLTFWGGLGIMSPQKVGEQKFSLPFS